MSQQSLPKQNDDIARNGDAPQTTTSEITIVPLTRDHLKAAYQIETQFQVHRKGFFFGLIPYSWCPPSIQEFEYIYQLDPNRMTTYGVALSQGGKEVLGICKGRRYGQRMTWDESAIHDPQRREFYIDSLAVTEQARGKGVGTKLLQWAQDLALSLGDTRLTLGVMARNPAIRLYERFGFEEYERDWCCSGCLLGRPHGSCASIEMEKVLSKTTT